MTRFIKKSRLILCASLLFLIDYILANPLREESRSFKETCKEEICNEWEEINTVDVEGKFQVGKYRSKRTGLTLFLSRSETPIVNGYFCLATEAFDNDGLPHTLEHLIFRGSEDYPYKDTLDNLAAR